MNPACPYCGFASPWSCDHFICPVCGHDIDVDDGDMYYEPLAAAYFNNKARNKVFVRSRGARIDEDPEEVESTSIWKEV